MLTGDVSDAFRHIPINAEAVACFAGTVPELGILVVDLCCFFGWTDSPGHYWVAGDAIKHLHSLGRPCWPDQPAGGQDVFDSKAWCDDHTCIEPDIDPRLVEAELSLRRSMVTVLGPEACNEDKFSTWFVRGTTLGLDWDLQAETASMPEAKITKAIARIDALLAARSATRSVLNQLLGSLRHVVTCVRPAASFFQRVADLARSTRRHTAAPLTAPVLEDLRWFRAIIGTAHLNASEPALGLPRTPRL